MFQSEIDLHTPSTRWLCARVSRRLDKGPEFPAFQKNTHFLPLLRAFENAICDTSLASPTGSA